MELQQGTGLALSGGGYRATLFHMGSLLRLNEMGYLPRLTDITSVSGGSIIAGYLGKQWHQLAFDNRGVATNLDAVVMQPLRQFCSKTIDWQSTVKGWLTPGRHASAYVIKAYQRALFGGATLADLPAVGMGPRFVLYATSLHTGASVRFSRVGMHEYHFGDYAGEDTLLAKVVAASSAFPPVFCPVRFDLDPSRWKAGPYADLYVKREGYRTFYLADGGIYDNMGLEYYRKPERQSMTLLISDAGALFAVKRGPGMMRWSHLMRTLRTLSIASEQTRALRKRHQIQAYREGLREGAYWGIGTRIGSYAGRGDLPLMVQDTPQTQALCEVRTRLNRFTEKEQGRLINWGYALTDAAVRAFLPEPDPVPMGRWPVPAYALG